MGSQAMGTRLVGSGLAVLLLVGLAACGGPPKWVEKGSGYMNDKDSKAFYGVGSVTGVRNEPLAWDTAENRARAEIAKTFETYTGYLMRDNAASTTAGGFTRNTEEQNVERAIKTVTTVTLSGVRPMERYKDEETNTYYVFVGCNDQPATYEAYLTVQDDTPTKLRMQVVGDDACSGRTNALKGIGQLQTPAGAVTEPAKETEARITSPEALVGNWVGRSDGYVVLHKFGEDGTLVVNVTGVGVIGSGPYVFEDDLLKIEDASGDCEGLVGLYEVYGIYLGDELARLRFVMNGQDTCTDRRNTLDGKFLTPN